MKQEIGGNDNLLITMESSGIPSQQSHAAQSISNEQRTIQKRPISTFRRRRRTNSDGIPMMATILGVGVLFALSIILSVDVVVRERGDLSSHTINNKQQQQQPSWYQLLLQSSRRLWSLSDDEVQQRIFQRHNDAPPTRSAITTAPVVGGIKPTATPTMMKVPSVIVPSTPTSPSAPIIGTIPTVPTIIMTPTTGITPTIPKTPSSITTKPGGTTPPSQTMAPSNTATPTKDGSAKLPPIPFGQIGPTMTPKMSDMTNSPVNTSGVDIPTSVPNAVLPTMTSVSPVPSMIQQPVGPINNSNNGTSFTPSIAGVPSMLPNLNNSTTTSPSTIPNSNSTTNAPSVLSMNGTMSDLPSIIPSIVPGQNSTTVSPMMVVNDTTVSPMMVIGNDTSTPSMSPNNITFGNETNVPSMSPNTNITIETPVGGNVSIQPTLIETTLRFLERSFQLEDGIVSQAGTYQNMAYTSLMTNFPNLTPMNGNQMEIVQIFSLNCLYYSLNGTKWRTRTGWTGPEEPCSTVNEIIWYGVSCTTGDVTKIDLSENDLLGAIPSELKGLSNLGR
jgi:hypothetical protein